MPEFDINWESEAVEENTHYIRSQDWPQTVTELDLICQPDGVALEEADGFSATIHIGEVTCKDCLEWLHA